MEMSDAGIADLHKRVTIAAKKNPKIKERLRIILRYISMLKADIKRNNTRKAIFDTSFLDYELYGCGFAKPYLSNVGRSKGGRKRKRPWVWEVLRNVYPKAKTKTFPAILNFLIANHVEKEKAIKLSRGKAWISPVAGEQTLFYDGPKGIDYVKFESIRRRYRIHEILGRK